MVTRWEPRDIMNSVASSQAAINLQETVSVSFLIMFFFPVTHFSRFCHLFCLAFFIFNAPASLFQLLHACFPVLQKSVLPFVVLLLSLMLILLLIF